MPGGTPPALCSVSSEKRSSYVERGCPRKGREMLDKRRPSVKWMLLSLLALGLAGGALTYFVIAQPLARHIPPCEAMSIYLYYQGRFYYEEPSVVLAGSEKGRIVTSVGDGPDQARSCQIVNGTKVYSVQGRPITTDLAIDDNGLILFEGRSGTPTPTASPPGQAGSPLPERLGEQQGRLPRVPLS